MRRLGVVPIVMILAGCAFSENRSLARAVTSDELVGRWRATEFAIRSLRDVGVRDHRTVQAHTLVLRADGSCSLQTLMNMPVLEAAEYRTYDTGCRWRLGAIGHQALLVRTERLGRARGARRIGARHATARRGERNEYAPDSLPRCIVPGHF